MCKYANIKPLIGLLLVFAFVGCDLLGDREAPRLEEMAEATVSQPTNGAVIGAGEVLRVQGEVRAQPGVTVGGVRVIFFKTDDPSKRVEGVFPAPGLAEKGRTVHRYRLDVRLQGAGDLPAGSYSLQVKIPVFQGEDGLGLDNMVRGILVR